MKFALCNEIFRNLSLEDAFQKIADIGYDGVEIAPFTLQSNPRDLNESDADRCRVAAENAGLEIVGLHWLMAETEGLHLTHIDPAILKVTQEYLIKLGKLTARMNGSILVLGSPQQRNLLPGTSYEQAFERAVKLMKAVCGEIEDLGVAFAIEPLAKVETDFLSSCAEGRDFVRTVDHPACGLHLDVKAMTAEPNGVCPAIREFYGDCIHFHANDSNLRGPGQGGTNFTEVANTLKEVNYDRWVSVEAFDYFPDEEECARLSLDCLQKAFLEV
jgi:sugar phosphate isomerase/epimerase